MCESKVHAWLKPRASALFVSSTTRQAGGSAWNVTPKSMSAPSLLLLVPPLAELRAESVGVQLHQKDAVELDLGSRRHPSEVRTPAGDSLVLRYRDDLVGEVDVLLRTRPFRPVLQDLCVPPGRLVEGGLVVGRILCEQPCRGLRIPRLPGMSVGVEPATKGL